MQIGSSYENVHHRKLPTIHTVLYICRAIDFNMGNNNSVNDSALAGGWRATVRQYLGLGADYFGNVADWSINLVREIALNIGRNVQNTLNGNFSATINPIHQTANAIQLPSLATVIQQIVTSHLATNQDFVSICEQLVGRIVTKVLTHTVVMGSFRGALQDLLTALGGEGPIANALAKILTDAISHLSKKAIRVPNTARNALAVSTCGSRTQIANAHAINFFLTSVSINGGILLYDLLYLFYEHRQTPQIFTRDEYNQQAKKRITATFCSVVGGTAGAYVAALMAPEYFYIKLFGGTIGGIIGQHVGIMIYKD